MSKSYRAVSIMELKNETIKEVAYKIPEGYGMTFRPYQAYCVYTESGRKFVLYSSMGEQCCNELIEKT